MGDKSTGETEIETSTTFNRLLQASSDHSTVVLRSHLQHCHIALKIKTIFPSNSMVWDLQVILNRWGECKVWNYFGLSQANEISIMLFDNIRVNQEKWVSQEKPQARLPLH